MTRSCPGTLLAACLAFAACSQPAPRVPESTPPPVPAANYARAADEGARLYRVDPDDSLILVRVGRAGAMRRLGHDHAVAGEDLRGLVAWSDKGGKTFADIVFAPRDLVVDRPAHRQRLELGTEPAEDDIRGTYDNMLKVLEPDAFPWVRMHASALSTNAESIEADVTVTLHGQDHSYRLPVALERSDERLVVSGQATIRHADFGLEPYSAAGGLLRVADALEVDFRIVAVVTGSGDLE